MHTYVDPELDAAPYRLDTRETKSTLVPIKNEFVQYLRSGDPRPPILMLRYVDDAVWFDIPFSTEKVGVFRGKLVNMSFTTCFFRVCRAMNPQLNRKNSWQSVRLFVQSQKGRLTEMGITPKHLYSQKATWDEYLVEYNQTVEAWRKSQKK